MTLLTRSHDDILERIAPDLVRPLEVVKREHIERAMVLCRGNVALAAKRLQMSRTNLLRMLALYRKADA